MSQRSWLYFCQLRTIHLTEQLVGGCCQPTMDEWDAAATYSVKLSLPQPELLNTNKTELILAIPYEGDALRVYYKDKLLVRPCVQCHDCDRAA